LSIDGNEQYNQNLTAKLSNMAQGLQDRLELEFKGQMIASKEELMF
jgi:hypothetical protein